MHRRGIDLDGLGSRQSMYGSQMWEVGRGIQRRVLYVMGGLLDWVI